MQGGARVRQYTLMAVVLAFFAIFLLYPIWLTVRGGFVDDPITREGFTLRHVALVFRDPVLRDGLINSLLLALTATGLSLLFGLPLGMLSARCQYPFKRTLDAAILAPLILPPFVGAIGLKAILGRTGSLNMLLGTDWDILGTARFWGVAVAMALHLYPIIYLNVKAAAGGIDPSMDEAAQVAGAHPIIRLLRVSFPMLLPGVFAGASIVLIWSFTELGTPLIFDYNVVTAVQIFQGIKEMDASSEPYALTAVMLIVATIMYFISKTLLVSDGSVATTRVLRAGETKILRGPGAWQTAGLFFAVIALALVPHLGVVLMSLSQPESWNESILPTRWTTGNYAAALGHPLVSGAIRNSLVLSLAAATISMGLGIAIGYLVVRTKLVGRKAVDSLSMLPLAVPGLVMAFGFVAVSMSWPFGKGDPLDGLIDVVGSNPNPLPLLAVAYAVRRLPYIVRATVAGLQQVSVELEEAATLFGARLIDRFRTIVLPLILGNLFAGGLLVFAFSMLEVSDSLILAQQERHYPITKAIYMLTERLNDGTVLACATGVWAMVLLAVCLGLATSFFGKSLGSVFRV
ncbi:MAG: iron ABC transporter permease [Phycisphaeraceae bacterium]|nr:iron ABC transporter permease [Phycisphaeraceae bacterium]MCB9848387.1 iron ABC transporter permease [Phycisphaeraceae bacterium]